MVWIILWCLCGVATGVTITFKSYKLTGEVSLGDVFRVFVVGPLCGAVGLLFILLILSDDFTLYKKKKLDNS